MRRMFYILVLVSLFQNFSCQKHKNNTSQIITEIDTIKKVKSLKRLFVKAKNGLNYRDKPNGNIIGKYLYNQPLDIVKHSGVSQDIYENDNLIHGEWLAVIRNNDTVYVFDAYLTHWKDVSLLRHENEFYIEVKTLNEGKVQEFKNDTIVLQVFDLAKFATLTEISSKDFDTIYNTNRKFNTIDSIIKRNNSIRIKCLNSKTEVFKDTDLDNDELSKIYQYKTTFEKIKSHLVVVSGWEWGGYYLINYETCKLTKLNGFPIFNKDYSKIICFDTDPGDESIFISLFDGTSIIKKYNLNINLIPNRSIFYNDSLFLETLTEWNDGNQHKFSKQYFKLIFKE